MLFAAVQSLSLPSLLAALFLALLAASEFGHRLGGRHAGPAGGGVRDGEAGMIATATFGLLALLIAFTYSMALTRYDLRRAVVLDEANALRNAAHVASLLPDDDGVAIGYDLRRMLDLALGLGVPFDPQKFGADVAETASVSTRLWDHLRTVTAAQPASSPVPLPAALAATRLTEALTALDDAVARRTTALRDHVPMTIYAMLIGTALVAMAFAGYGAGAAAASRRVSAAVMSLLLSFVVTVTIDLQRPDRGTVEIPLAPLTDLRTLLPPLP